MSETKRITSDTILSGMARRWAAPEWALFFNVANGTGARAYRYADALAMCLFPSRGLEIHGFEIKVSKSDYRKEGADPEKAETIAAYCDRWWVVTPPNLLDGEIIPPNWGWLAFDGRAFYTKQKAEKTPAKQLDRPFLAALLRRAHESNAALIDAQCQEKLAGNELEIRRRVDSELSHRTHTLKNLQDAVAEFEAKAGVSINDWRGGEIGKAVKIVLATGVTNTYDRGKRMAENLRRIAQSLDEAMNDPAFITPEDVESEISKLENHIGKRRGVPA